MPNYIHERRVKFGGGWAACTERTAQGKDFELILKAKMENRMETRHPAEGQLGYEFPAICNHCGVMTYDGLNWQYLTIL